MLISIVSVLKWSNLPTRLSPLPRISHLGRWRLGIQATIARAFAGIENRRLAFELKDAAMNVGLAREHAGVVDQVARRK
ncbi:MAG: hypothetical protein HW419_3492, partial [Deltaproteobacteria bacterium]|nr:hypothetical protein [Deltaproteobacteria bacterium]